MRENVPHSSDSQDGPPAPDLANTFLESGAEEIVRKMIFPHELKRISSLSDTQGECWVEVFAGEDEVFRFLVNAGGEETEAQKNARFASDLQDWISESGFAWGQLRHYS